MQYISDVAVRNITTRKELQQFVRDDSSVSLIKNTPCIIHFLFCPPQILSRFPCMMHYGWGNLVPVHARVCVLRARAWPSWRRRPTRREGRSLLLPWRHGHWKNPEDFHMSLEAEAREVGAAAAGFLNDSEERRNGRRNIGRRRRSLQRIARVV